MSQATEEVPTEATEPQKRVTYWQVDALKAFAIALVVMDHSLTWELKSAIGGVFWERTAIPIFMIVMGFNMGLSFKRRGATSLRELYSWSYFKNKIQRYVFPFLILYVASFLLGVFFNAVTFNEYSLIGWLPFWGPGNWFIPVLLSSILVLPLVYRGYITRPKLTIFLCFMSEVLLQLFLFTNVPLVLVDGAYQFTSYEAAFLTTVIRTNVLFLLPGVGLGLWFSDGPGINAKRNRLMWVAVPLSVVYMFAYQFLGYRVEIIEGIYKYRLIWGDYTFLVIPYSALLFLLAMKYLPYQPQNRVQNVIQKIGRASYHIFLFQIFYYSIWYHLNPNWAYVGFGSDVGYHIWFYGLNLLLTFFVGIAWYDAERISYRRGKAWWHHNYVKRSFYMSIAAAMLLSMGTIIDFLSEVTGLREAAERYPIIWLNRRTGPGFMVNFLAIVIILGVLLLFMYKAFTIVDEEVPFEVLEGRSAE
ncbi:MAG: acyltransferase family protein [Promethearchaeota archaeon]